MKISAYIPEDYIPAQSGRMEMYKKISLITSPEDGEDILDELIDRYGNPPRPVERLLEVALMKALCEERKAYFVDMCDIANTIGC